jgi:hypothetical protein
MLSLLDLRASPRKKPRRRNSNIVETKGTNVADRIIVYWRDIPAQVIVKKRRQAAKRELPLRFTEAIDMCAMRVGARDTDAYLAEWRKGDPEPVGDDLEAEADKAAERLDAEYTQERLKALIRSEGFDKDDAA